MTTAHATPEVALHRIVELATRAPSVHNTQPWRWRASGHSLDLYADRARQLLGSDPSGRNLIISCGCVLHHVQVVAHGLGWAAEVTRFPAPGARPDHLARVDLSRSATRTSSASGVLDVVQRRSTDRRRFTAWPVPEERLADLAAEAAHWQAHAVPVVDARERVHAERLINRAAELAARAPAMAAEQSAWIDRGDTEGVPSTILPAVPGPRANRFPPGSLEEDRVELVASDGLILMYGHDDTPLTWLRTGEGLSALWLSATRGGLSVVPLSQVVEVPSTAAELRLEILGGLAHPLIAARIGWQAISRSDLAVTPRRGVDDVLDLR